LKTRVPSEFPSTLPCKIAFVGEAPSDDEILKRRPLVGPSGRVFNQLLATANLRREECFVGNVFDFQLPDNEVKNICGSTAERQEWPHYDLPPIAKGAYLRPEYIPQLQRLADELHRAAPTVVVPLGGTALWALTGAGNITASRGSVLVASALRPGVKVVPTLHPAHVIREWKYFHVVVADILKAIAESAFPEVRPPYRELWLSPTLSDLREFKRKYIDHADLLTVDIETGWKQITCVGFAPSAERAICVPFWDLRQPSHSFWDSTETEIAAWYLVQGILESPVPKLLQNGPYDIYWLWHKYGIRVRNYRHDTRLIHHALYPELPKSLEFMGATYGRQGPWKEMAPHKQQEKRDA